MPLKYLTNFQKSLEMRLINFKIELKLKWIKYCVLSANGNDDAYNNNNSNNNNNNNVDKISFTLKPKKLSVPVVNLQLETIKNCQIRNLLATDLKDQLIGIKIKQK